MKPPASHTTQCGSKNVSGQSLLKTGLLPARAGDFRQFLAIGCSILEVETPWIMQESLHFAGFLRFRCKLSYVE
jgi:hypothetical protein